MLAALPKPDRGLCLRLGDTLARAGRLAEALGAFRGAARLGPLRPEELGELACGLARAVGLRERRILLLPLPRPSRAIRAPGDRRSSPVPPTPRALLSCPRCRKLLYKPVTLPNGVTVCKRCVEMGSARPGARRVNVVLSGLVERCFPAECRLRRLAGQARNLQRQQQLDAALLKCEQALALAPEDDSLLLLRAELCLMVKNYEQALQDTDIVCRKEPLLTKGHHLKAQALAGLGRSKEVLKEFIYCLALNPECNSAKKETQKVICEVFFPPSEENTNQNSSSSTNGRLKAHCDGQTNTQAEEDDDPGSPENSSERVDMFRNTNSSVLYFILGLHFEEDKKALENVIPVAPSTGVKRRLPVDIDDAPGKIPRKDADIPPQRTVISKLGGDTDDFLIDVTDFECALCMRLLFEPVTTPCGHTFCLKCLERCLDHAPHCPLCKDKLSELLATRNFNITILAEELIFQYLQEELSDRKRIYDEEMSELSNLTRDVPIFVCAMAFPTVPCPLHVFEPRYRLMIRRCMETGTKRFGMCLSAEHAGISEYGCMLEIKDVRTFPDGSSVVDAIGISRFRVLSHRHRDGYNTADIEYLEDEKVEGPEYEELTTLHDSVYQQSVSWFSSLQDHMKEQILSHFGGMPDREPEPQVCYSFSVLDAAISCCNMLDVLFQWTENPRIPDHLEGLFPCFSVVTPFPHL
ncbi:LON peptidase N-terminal domain and RING finger protein 2 isoform X1 [Perognathus longimembris pacificus]|uniref:LON peptidase N-terminal domain and RING finger protein 2 isoform X1 n=1 Tax=Perognathus longimembris pacificus TaxID=214514 RepID=UPI0020198C1A|nr:LON peptidase N-terminal domain and RING finger protein 2 isoform X1 [Perognathus longimembris pacificus]